MARNKPSKRELELSERAKREPEKVKREIVTDQEKRKIVGQYGLDLEDYDDLAKMGERPKGNEVTVSSPTTGVSYTMEHGKSREQEAWDARLKELRERAESRRAAKSQREVDDYTAAIRGEETPTQKENRQNAEAASPVTTAAAVPSTATSSPTGNQPGAQPSALNPASGSKRGSVPSRSPLASVGKNDRTGTTVSVNGQGMRPTTENVSLVNSIQRQQMLDAPTGVDVTSPLYTNAEVRLMRRREAEIQRYRDIRQSAIDARNRADETARSRGALRNADDWKYYGSVANSGGDGWKKGGADYNDAMEMLRGKIRSLQDLGAAGYTPSSQKAIANLVTMVEDSDKLGGLSQRQIEVANGLVNGWMSDANARKDRIAARNTYEMNKLRTSLGLAEGTPDKDVLAADRDVRGKAVSGALDALRDPNVWNTPDYYKHLETIQKNSENGMGLASSFRAAMRDPVARRRYNDAVTQLTGGGVLPDAEGVADLQNRFAIEHMQAQRSAGPQLPVSQPLVRQTNPEDDKNNGLGVQAAQFAGDALRPRRKGVL